ncbi:MAG: hypothetical protein AAGD14_09140 [Planctomycetota bacterium]
MRITLLTLLLLGVGTRAGDEDPPPQPAAAPKLLEVRDLANGDPVADVEFEIVVGRETRVVRTDANGRIPGSAAAVSKVTSRMPGWTILVPPRDGRIWIARRIVIEAPVSGHFDAFEADRVQFKASCTETRDWDGPSARRMSRLQRMTVKRPVHDATYRIELYRLRGLMLHAMAAGGATISVSLDCHFGRALVPIDFTFRAARHIQGVVLDARTRKPVEGVHVLSHTVIKLGKDATASDARQLSLRGGFAYSKRSGENPYARFNGRAKSEEDGRWAIDLPGEGGHTYVTVLTKGYAAIELDLGRFRGARINVDLDLGPAKPSPRVVVRRNGEPITKTSLMFIDLDRGDGRVQHMVPVFADANGRIGTAWLHRGRQYAVIPGWKGAASFARWNGEATMVLIERPTDK